MRITGGVLRGRLVTVPPGVIRPAMDRMRESLFATLGDLEGLSFLDLFSGSGVIALEAASRGASPVEAVEADPLKRKVLLQNVSLSSERIQCHFMPAESFVKRGKKSFALIFCDPPFNYRFKWDLLLAILQSPLTETGSRILLHRPREDRAPQDFPIRSPDSSQTAPETPPLAVLEQSKIYGRSILDFFCRL